MRPVVERTSREPDDAAGTTAAKLSWRWRIDAVIRQVRREQPRPATTSEIQSSGDGIASLSASRPTNLRTSNVMVMTRSERIGNSRAGGSSCAGGQRAGGKFKDMRLKSRRHIW